MMMMICFLFILNILGAVLIMYGIIVFLIGNFTMTNKMLTQLIKLSFNQGYQEKYLDEISRVVNKHMKEQLSKIIDTKNEKLMKQLKGNISEHNLNAFKTMLTETINHHDMLLNRTYIKKFCHENAIFSFSKNLNALIKLLSRCNENQNIDLVHIVIKNIPLYVPLNVNDLYHAVFASAY